MLRNLFGALALVALVSTSTVSAHEQFRVIGKIESFDKWQLEVKTAYGETFFFLLQEYTPIWREKKMVTAKEIKVGGSVVVDVSADSLYDHDRFIVSVTLVPPIPPKKAK
jgi:hypothetical protein